MHGARALGRLALACPRRLSLHLGRCAGRELSSVPLTSAVALVSSLDTYTLLAAPVALKVPCCPLGLTPE